MRKFLVLPGILLLICTSAFSATMGERNALASLISSGTNQLKRLYFAKRGDIYEYW